MWEKQVYAARQPSLPGFRTDSQAPYRPCQASEGKDRSPEADRIIVKGLFATLTNVSFDDNALNELLEEAGRLKDSLSPMCGSCTADCGRTEDLT